MAESKSIKADTLFSNQRQPRLLAPASSSLPRQAAATNSSPVAPTPDVRIDDDELAKVLVHLNSNPALTTPLFVTMHPTRAAAAGNRAHEESDYMAEDAFSSSGTSAELHTSIRSNRGKKRRILTREEEVMRKWRGRLCRQCGHNRKTCNKNSVSLHSRPK